MELVNIDLGDPPSLSFDVQATAERSDDACGLFPIECLCGAYGILVRSKK